MLVNYTFLLAIAHHVMAVNSRSTSRARFRYEKLNPTKDEIRLICVLPGEASDELRCIMFHASISEHPYLALSYAWQEPGLFAQQKLDETELLIVHEAKEYPASLVKDVCASTNPKSFRRRYRSYLRLGHPGLKIGVNLAAYLRKTRGSDTMTELLWIDAICINQEDTEERNAQVLRMASIYQSARRVVVWLGPADKDSEVAMSFVENLEQKFIAKAQCASCTLLKSYRCHVCIRGIIESHTTSEGWDALFRLLSRSWFSRTWVVQELVLAKDVILLPGPTPSTHVTWEDFECVLASIVILQSDWIEGFLMDQGVNVDVDGFDRAISLAELRRTQTVQNEKGLMRVLRYTIESHCADLRDKIYGVLSLASDGEVLVPAPDYSLSVAQVYKDLTRSSIITSGNLDHLSFARSSATALNVPSWCLDLFENPVTNTIATFGGKSFSASKLSRPSLKTSGSTMRMEMIESWPDGMDPEVLTLAGFCVDLVDGMGAGLAGSSDDSIVQPLSRQTAYSTSRDIFKAIWLAIIAGTDREVFPKLPDDAVGRLFAAQCYLHHLHSTSGMDSSNGATNQARRDDTLSDLYGWYLVNKDLIISNKTISAWVTEFREVDVHLEICPPREHPQWDSFGWSFRRAIEGRKLMTTEKGYIGLVPNHVRRGDLLCILFGGKCPVILRKMNDPHRDDPYYIVLGESYVHGLMFGEGMDDLDKGLYNIQDFYLH